MFISTYDEVTSTQKIELRNYFDKTNSPDKDSRQKTSVSYTPTTSNQSRFFIGNGYGDGLGKLNLYKGLIDDVRIYSRVISDDEIDTIYNLSDSEPPIPGGGLAFPTSGSCSGGLTWNKAEDDKTGQTELLYKVVKNSANRISNAESALLNDQLGHNWTANIDCYNAGNINAGDWATVLVKDNGGNTISYGTIQR